MELAASWLRFHRLAARAAQVTIRYGDYQTADGRTAFPYPTDRDRDLQEGIRECFERLYQRRLPLRDPLSQASRVTRSIAQSRVRR